MFYYFYIEGHDLKLENQSFLSSYTKKKHKNYLIFRLFLLLDFINGDVYYYLFYFNRDATQLLTLFFFRSTQLSYISTWGTLYRTMTTFESSHINLSLKSLLSSML